MYNPQQDVRDRLHLEGAFDVKHNKTHKTDYPLFIFIIIFLLVPFPIAAKITQTLDISYIYSHLISVTLIVFGYKLIKNKL
jgi:hypothetical protein